MKREDLFDAIGHVDESLLDEDAVPNEPVIWRWVAGMTTAAACIAVVLGTAAWANLHKIPPAEPQDLPTDAATEAETAAPSEAAPPPDEQRIAAYTERSTQPGAYNETAAAVNTAVSTTTAEIVESKAFSTDISVTVSDTTETAAVTQVSWEQAYRDLLEELHAENFFDAYSLLYIDGDDVPEFAASTGTTVSLYTYADGLVYLLMDHYPFAVSGNIGYYYVPGENRIAFRDYTDAGLHVWFTCMHITDAQTLEVDNEVEALYFDDLNGNSMYDEGEPYEEGNENFPRYYMDDVEISAEEAAPYIDYVYGDYPMIYGYSTYDEMLGQLEPVYDEERSEIG